jgi:hypothetical protein
MARLTPDYVIASLVQRGVPQHIAQGVVMNFQDESGLNTGIQEKAPLSGRGGFGLAQWTGPRRVALEDFARSQGKRIDDPDVQLDFFMQENQGPEAPAWKAVMSAPTVQDAAVAFVNKWERPTSRHAAERSARYMGQGPGEGDAGRFGGTGLGTPVNMADSPSEGGARFGGTGLGTPAVATADADKKKRPWWKKMLGDVAAGATNFGGGGAAPAPLAPSPGAAVSQLQPVSPVNPQQQEMQRQMLAQALARLNQGTLWG